MLPSTPGLSLSALPLEAPLWVRTVLWLAIGIALLMAAGIGIFMIAGVRNSAGQSLRSFCVAFGVTLVAQIGYLSAPFAVGRGWWLWSFLAMLPIALLALMACSVPIIGAMKWTRPDGASGWKTIASMGWFTLISCVLYVTPPVLLWIYRPAAGQ